MKSRRAGELVFAVAMGWAALVPAAARAQVGGVPGGSNPSQYANPFTNPMNPYLNPYMAQMTQPNMNAGNAALYFFAAQQAQGGIGSGRLSGVRPARGPQTSTPPGGARGAAPNSSMVPGGNAAGYFNRGTRTADGMAQHYNRQGRYFPKNGQ